MEANYWILILALPIGIVLWFWWAFIHELSHYLAAKRWGAKNPRFKIYPHRYLGDFRFAGVYYDWGVVVPSFRDRALIALAPRLPDCVAAALLPVAAAFDMPWRVVWLAFWGADLVNLFVGSLGISENSDLRRAAKWLEVDPWCFRLCGFAVLVASAAITAALLFRGAEI